MPLTNAQKERAWRVHVDNLAVDQATGSREPANWSKDELRSAADATAAWIEANIPSYVAALAGTGMAGNKSTADQKRRFFLAVYKSLFDLDE